MKLDRRNFLIATSIASMATRIKAEVIKESIQKHGLADAFVDDYHVGAAVSTDTIVSEDKPTLKLLEREFSSITAENCQKWEEVHPSEDSWNWSASDKFVDFGEQNNKHILGHALVWHSQIPSSVFQDKAGDTVSASVLRRRMENHIGTLVGRYKGRVHTWDVVNEAVSDDGYNDWRPSAWFQILGNRYMEEAFNLARQADPNAELLYNDYNMHYPQKREFLVGVFKDYLDRGVPLDGVGFQAHYMLDDPELEQIEKSIEAYSALGLPIHITELDVDVLPKAFEYMGAEISTNFEYSDKLNPYPTELPEIIQERLASRYEKLFGLFSKHQDRIKRVTLWGVSDADSWKNNWPVRGRTNYPLLFDRQLNPKLAYRRLMNLKR